MMQFRTDEDGAITGVDRRGESDAMLLMADGTPVRDIVDAIGSISPISYNDGVWRFDKIRIEKLVLENGSEVDLPSVAGR